MNTSGKAATLFALNGLISYWGNEFLTSPTTSCSMATVAAVCICVVPSTSGSMTTLYFWPAGSSALESTSRAAAITASLYGKATMGAGAAAGGGDATVVVATGAA